MRLTSKQFHGPERSFTQIPLALNHLNYETDTWQTNVSSESDLKSASNQLLIMYYLLSSCTRKYCWVNLNSHI